MRKLTDEQMTKLRSQGRLTIKKGAPETETPKVHDSTRMSKDDHTDRVIAESVDRQAQATADLARTLGEGQMRLVEQLKTVLIENQKEGVKPIPYRFTIKRDRRGLMEDIIARPILDDEQ